MVGCAHWRHLASNLEGMAAGGRNRASPGSAQSASEIIRRKGATNHAIGLVTADLLQCLIRDERRVLTVSRVQDGALGFRDIALSLPTIVGIDGAVEVIEPEMSTEERKGLQHSSEVLRRAAAEIE
jgi:L-lactate dehydrogenase